ncbi:MAG TPA: ATP-binding protein [Candidatus Eremiobacteraceae bacterium]|nr:ATP-binding protein [Candidatus Eremiobacteraceae bacterium]
MPGRLADLLRAFAESDDVAAVCTALASGVGRATGAAFSIAAVRETDGDFVEAFGDQAAPWRLVARLQGACNRARAKGDARLLAMLNGEAVRAIDLSALPEDDGEFVRLLREFGVRRVAAWPIAAGDPCRGTVVAFDPGPTAIDDDQADDVTLLADHAGRALARARRFEALRAESERGTALIAESAEGICTFDHELRVSLWNHAAERITGILRDAIVGKTMSAAGLQPHAPQFPHAFNSFAEASAIFIEEPGRAIDVRLSAANGQPIWISLAAALIGASARRHSLACCFRDITEQKELESLRSDFVSLVTHQLRTPLTAIRGYAELVAAIEMPSERVREYGDIIAGASARLADSITDVMDFERLAASRDGLRVTPVSLRTALELGVAAIKLPPSHRVELPEGLSEFTVAADTDRLSRLFAHVLGNAVRYWPDGGSIEVAASRDGDFVRCSIIDHGPGIAVSERADLFSPYHRAARGHPSASQGLGLGLSLAKRIVEAHRGRIALAETPGGGATVTVWLPAASRLNGSTERIGVTDLTEGADVSRPRRT